MSEIVVTHPEFPSQALTVEDQQALVQRGALLERCFTTPHTGKIAWEVWVEHIRATGPAKSVLSTDLGQVFNPPVEDGMALMVDRLLEAGFTDPFNPDHPVAYQAVARAHGLAAGAGVQSAFDTVRPPELFLLEPHQPELCKLHPEHVCRHHPGRQSHSPCRDGRGRGR